MSNVVPYGKTIKVEGFTVYRKFPEQIKIIESNATPYKVKDK